MSEETKEPEVRELEEEEAAKAFAEDAQSAGDRMSAAIDPEAAATEPPDWAVVPEGLRLPEEGSQIAFIRIPAKWTTTPARGDRVCVVWPIGETEERLAYARARGDVVRSVSELSKAAIRAIDGNKADWSGNMAKPGSVTSFWTQIGPKGRQMVRNWYVRTHTVTDDEALSFFSQHFACVTVRRG
jgi:hypothetical protein